MQVALEQVVLATVRAGKRPTPIMNIVLSAVRAAFVNASFSGSVRNRVRQELRAALLVTVPAPKKFELMH
jgi:hypothetical protein